MAWPSGTKASTNNVDNGTDLISNARADIKQNIDNVNDIIDTFNISSPSDGDLLQYSTSSGQWEQVASSSIASAPSYASFQLDSGLGELVGSVYRKGITSVTNIYGDTIITGEPDSANDTIITIAAGTYVVTPFPGRTVGENASNLTIYDETNSTDLATSVFTPNEVATTGESLIVGFDTFTVSTSVDISFRVSGSTTNRIDASYSGILQKIA